MDDKRLKIYLALHIGSKLKIKDIQNNLNIYKNIFYNAINNNLCIPEYLESLGFTLVDRDRWSKLNKITKKEYIRRLDQVKRERSKDYKDCIVNRSLQHNPFGTLR